MKSQFMDPESSRSNSRFGRMLRPPLVASGTLAMSVIPASALGPVMKASAMQIAAWFESSVFLVMMPPDSGLLLAAHQCLDERGRVPRAGHAHRHAEMLRRQ